MSPQSVFQACETGAVFSASPAEWRQMLQALAQLSGPNPSPHAKAAQCGALIRHLIELDEARRSQRLTLRWARLAAYSAVVAIAVMLGQCAQSYFGFRARHESAAPATQPSSPSP